VSEEDPKVQPTSTANANSEQTGKGAPKEPEACQNGSPIHEPQGDSGARQSPGPRTPEGKARSSQNARTHGLFARQLHFDSEADRQEFEAFHEELRQDLKPRGALQEMIVGLMANCLWRQGELQGLIALYFSKLGNTNWASTLQNFMGKSSSLKLPVPGIPQPDGPNSKARDSWTPYQCRELSLKLVGGDSNVHNTHEVSGTDLKFQKDTKDKRSKTATLERFELEMKLGDSLELFRRYESALKKELFQLIETLERLQRRKPAHDE